MKTSTLALAVLAVTLPSLALAGEPAKMSDSDLDATVAAGYSIKNPQQLNAAINAHSGDFQKLAADNKDFYFAHETEVKKVVEPKFWYLLPTK